MRELDDASVVRESSLRSRSVGLTESVAMSAAFIGPAVGVMFGNIYIAKFSGWGMALTYLTSTIVSLTIAKAVGDFARKLPSAGAFYTYLTQSMGSRVGFVTGLLIFLGYACLYPMQLAIIGFFGHDLLNQVGIHIPWLVFSLVLLAISMSLGIAGIQPSLKTGLIGVAFEVTVLMVLSLIIVFHGGATGNSFTPFHYASIPGGISGLALGMVFAIFSFVGFESSATLGEEAREPRRTIPKAVFLTVIVVGAFFTFVAYAETIGFGFSTTGLHALQNDPIAFNTLALKYGGPVLSVFVDLAAVSSVVALNIVCFAATSRVIFAMGRDTVLPRMFGRVNSRKSPHVAGIAVAVWGALLVIVLGGALGPETAYGYLAFIATLGLIPVYLLLNIGVMKFYYQKHRSSFHWFGHGVIPIIGVLAMLLVLYGNVYPIPAAPYNYFIYVVIAYIVVVYLFAIWLDRKKPERVKLAGRLFADASE